eukprot:Opistho-2@36626
MEVTTHNRVLPGNRDRDALIRIHTPLAITTSETSAMARPYRSVGCVRAVPLEATFQCSPCGVRWTGVWRGIRGARCWPAQPPSASTRRLLPPAQSTPCPSAEDCKKQKIFHQQPTFISLTKAPIHTHTHIYSKKVTHIVDFGVQPKRTKRRGRVPVLLIAHTMKPGFFKCQRITNGTLACIGSLINWSALDP